MPALFSHAMATGETNGCQACPLILSCHGSRRPKSPHIFGRLLKARPLRVCVCRLQCLRVALRHGERGSRCCLQNARARCCTLRHNVLRDVPLRCLQHTRASCCTLWRNGLHDGPLRAWCKGHGLHRLVARRRLNWETYLRGRTCDRWHLHACDRLQACDSLHRKSTAWMQRGTHGL